MKQTFEKSHPSLIEEDRTAPNRANEPQTSDPSGTVKSEPIAEIVVLGEAQSAQAVVCSRCQTLNPSDRPLCSRCRSFLRANQVARKTGIYSRQPPPDDLREKVDDLRAGVIADRGGACELSTLELSYVEKLGDIDVTIRLLTHDISQNGLLTQGGRVRGVYDKLLAGLAAFDRYAQRIGLERKSNGESSAPVLRIQHVIVKSGTDAQGEKS